MIRDATLLSRMWLTSVAADATIRFEGTHPRLEKTASFVWSPDATNLTTLGCVIPSAGLLLIIR